MIRFSNLRDRIQTGFLFFCIIQFVLALALAIFSYHYGEDSALSRAVESNGTIEEFVSEESLPDSISAALTALNPGTHELSGQDNSRYTGKEIHVFVFDDPAGTRTWRLLEFSERVDNGSLLAAYSLFVVAAFLSLFLFGGWLGRTIAQRISRPLEVLVDRIKSTKNTNSQAQISKGFPAGEVKLIAEVLDDAFARINRAMNREKTFARNVSHELRTPLTVISTALGVDQTDRISPDSMTRARRACDEMELLTAACLDLSREAVSSAGNGSIPMAVTVKEIVKDYVYLLDGKDTNLEIVIRDSSVNSPAPGSLARLVIGNVIRNAFIHCPGGLISIVLSTTKLEVTNAMDISEQPALETRVDKRGIGVGLSVLGQACERLGWNFIINYKKGEKLAVATVAFT